MADSYTTNVCLNREPIAEQSRCKVLQSRMPKYTCPFIILRLAFAIGSHIYINVCVCARVFFILHYSCKGTLKRFRCIYAGECTSTRQTWANHWIKHNVEISGRGKCSCPRKWLGYLSQWFRCFPSKPTWQIHQTAPVACPRNTTPQRNCCNWPHQASGIQARWHSCGDLQFKISYRDPLYIYRSLLLRGWGHPKITMCW